MNNNTQISFGKITHPICFGMFAQEEFNRLAIVQGEAGFLGGVATTNVIYAGVFNAYLNKGKPVPKYEEIAELVADVIETDIEQIGEILEVYNTSRFGIGLAKQTNAIKKKLAENESQLELTGVPLEEQHTES